MQEQNFDFTNQKVVILGLARQGLALARFFVQAGAQVVISDAAPAEKLAAELAALGELPVELVLGNHPLTLLDGCHLLCLSGGVPPQLEIVQAAIARSIPLSNDSLLTLQLARQRGLGPLVAITGSSGKTTTTTLIGLMLQACGLRVHVGGNIGTPLLDRLESVLPGEPIVLELSSFQLELYDPALAYGSLAGVGPDVAAILNITPNHLDRHPDMAAYANAKFNLLRHLPPGATVVLSADDAVTQRLLDEHRLLDEQGRAKNLLPTAWKLAAIITVLQAVLHQQSAHLRAFSRQQPLASGAWLAAGNLVYNGQPFCQRDEICLRGDHNVSNLLAATAVAGATLERSQAGAVTTEIITALGQVARSFAGVAHRLEIVHAAHGVTWINDSIATAPERAVAALRSFAPDAQTLTLLAGGKDKKLPWEGFADETLARVDYLIGFGHAGPMIVEKVQERARYMKQRAPNCALVQRLDEAVELAARAAGLHEWGNGQLTAPPPALPTVILLSPGGTSYDAYRDFEQRGEHFRQLVEKWSK